MNGAVFDRCPGRGSDSTALSLGGPDLRAQERCAVSRVPVPTVSAWKRRGPWGVPPEPASPRRTPGRVRAL